MKSADQPEIIPLWQESAPGEEFLQEQETPLPGNRVVRNVSQPTLMAFLPDPSVAVGTAVIICPGGAFHFLSIESEGIEVARWLNQRGIAAFLLKYRLIPTAERDEAFLQQVQENVFSGNFPRLMNLMMQQAPLASADGRQAIQFIRERAAEWGIVPNRIGILGFSAGGLVALGATVQFSAATRPNFTAVLYTPSEEDMMVPGDVPPLFLVVANDDPLIINGSIPLYTAWKAVQRPVELHLYTQGGHGFGITKQGLPSDRWIDRFGEWLQTQGFLA